MKVLCSLRGAVRVGLVAVSVCTTALHAAAPLDGNFNASLNSFASSIALQPDGKILVGGNFTTVNGTPKSFLARLNADGALDNSFAPSNAPSQFVSRVLVANSNIYVAAGDGLRRFNTSGALTWQFPMNISVFAVDSQQRVIFGGQFTRVENQPHRNIARLSPNGTLDAAFATAIGCCAGESVDALATQGDAVLVGGLFQSVNETNVAAHLVRVTSGGLLDQTFNATATPRVLSIVPLPDGRIFRLSEQTLARHLANGADDPAFAPVSAGGSSDDRFVTLTVDNTGRPIVGGNFTLDGGATRTYVARFNPDGSLDTSFAVSPNAQVNTIAVQADGRVLMGGFFTEVNGLPRAGIARVVPEEPGTPNRLHITAMPNGAFVISWVHGGPFVLESRALNGTAWKPMVVTPVLVGGVNFVTNDASGAGRLFRLLTPQQNIAESSSANVAASE
jgi:uncharacterized delta-60 repeat protein